MLLCACLRGGGSCCRFGEVKVWGVRRSNNAKGAGGCLEAGRAGFKFRTQEHLVVVVVVVVVLLLLLAIFAVMGSR